MTHYVNCFLKIFLYIAFIGFAALERKTQKSYYDQNITHGFRKHKHTQHREEARQYRNGKIKSERKRDIQPHAFKLFANIAVFEKQYYNDDAQRGKRNVAGDRPVEQSVVFQPAVLREQADNYPDDRQRRYCRI